MSSPIDVGQLIDRGRWGGYQRLLVGLTALAIIFDGIDNQLMGVAIPTMMREWSVARSDFAPVVSLGYVGMMIGGAVAGLAGDRFGRRVALLASMVLFGVTTMAMTLVDSIAALAALRFVTGIGLGGAIPNAAALSAEYVPVRQRPFAVTLTISVHSGRCDPRRSHCHSRASGPRLACVVCLWRACPGGRRGCTAVGAS